MNFKPKKAFTPTCHLKSRVLCPLGLGYKAIK